MQRVLVIGSSGSGKSTLSARLGRLLSLPVIHLDQLYWGPGWVEADKTQWVEIVRAAMRGQSWVMDGNYSGTLAERLQACDTVVFLDIPRFICLWRVLVRIVRYHGKTRPEMPDGCPERFDVAFLLWVWNYPTRTRRKVLALLETFGVTKKVVRLRTSDEVEVFLREQRAA